MSVRWYDVLVANVTDRTIGLTWVGLPFDAEIPLSVRRVGGVLRIDLDQPQPPLNSDALGADRIPVLEFDQPRAAECHRGGHQAGIPGNGPSETPGCGRPGQRSGRPTFRANRSPGMGRPEPPACDGRRAVQSDPRPGSVGRTAGRTFGRGAWAGRLGPPFPIP